MGTEMRVGEDDLMLQWLRELVAVADPVPPGLQKAAGELLTWRTVDAELAALARAPAPATAD
jgi:hypothetical protein